MTCGVFSGFEIEIDSSTSTHWSLYKVTTILQTEVSNEYEYLNSVYNIIEIQMGVKLRICQYWFK